MVKALGVLLGIMFVEIVMDEARLMFEADLSFFSLLLRAVGGLEILVHVRFNSFALARIL